MNSDGTRVVIDVMLKPEILDAAGQAIERTLGHMGYEGVGDVRIGKRIEVAMSPDVEDPKAVADEIAEKLLANTVIEHFETHVE